MATNSPVVNRRSFKSKQRPASWFHPSGSMTAALAAAKSPMKSTRREKENPFLASTLLDASPTKSMALPIRGKHKRSPTPSPSNRDYDFDIASPCQVMTPSKSILRRDSQTGSSSPIPESPTATRYMPVNTVAKLRLPEDDSPVRHVPGHSRSLAAARSVKNRDDLFSPKAPTTRSASSSLFLDVVDEPPTPLRSMAPAPLFPIRTSQSQDSSQWKIPRCSGTSSRIPRMSASHPLRSRASTGERGLGLAQKKAISMGDMQADKLDSDSPFGSAYLHGRKARSSLGAVGGGFSNRTRRTGLGGEQSLSRSVGHKSGLSLSLSGGLRPMPDFSASNSSIASSVSSHTSITPPPSADNLFDNVKPNQEAFEPASFGVKSKFKFRDSTGSNTSLNSNDDKLMPPPSVLRPTVSIPGAGVKRARSLGHRPPLETPLEPPTDLASKFDFVCEGVSSFAFGGVPSDEKPMMPNTPVKRNSFSQSRRVVTSISQPVLGSDHSPADYFGNRAPIVAPPGSVRKPTSVPQLTLTETSSPADSGMDTDLNSPTMRLGSAKKTPSADPKRLDLLRRAATGSSSVDCSEDEVTPTKGHGERHILAGKFVHFELGLRSANNTPSPSPSPKANALLVPCSMPKETIVPRLSLPAFGSSNQRSRRVRHRQSHPVAPPILPEEEDIFESRFVVRYPLGKGAFSTVLLVQERQSQELFAVKKTRNVFDGVKDRLRHLEEIDVLRHLSKTPNPHVVRFVDAWEQNRQLYIQTEACVGTLAQFNEVYGTDNLRVDEGRVWKMARDIADGLYHIHSHGVIHFDIKTANILVAQDRSLKIADFGLATRWPRVSPLEIIAGSGLGGSVGLWTNSEEKLEREGDRVYMPPEMLNGVFVMAADIYSFGIVLLETALNVYLPDGGVHWRALRENDYSYVEMSTLSTPMADLIMACMQADPNLRPTIDQVVSHPVMQRVIATGGPALAPEDESWLQGILAETGHSLPAPIAVSSTSAVDGEGDVVMTDA